MKILISGAGITGNALAFWLSKLGHAVTIIERFPELRVSGLQVDLRSHGVAVMKRMGLEEAFRAHSIPEQGMQMVDKKGRRRAYFPASNSSNVKLGFSSDFEIMRGDLCQIIYDVAKARASYVFGTSIASFEQKSDVVDVRFVDGTSNQFDLVVGADGLGSRTRKLMLGDEAADAFRPLNGMYVGYFTFPKPIEDDEEYVATNYMATGKRGIMVRRHNAREVQAYVGGQTNSERLKKALAGSVTEQKGALTEMLQGAGWKADEILESLKGSDNFYCERMGQVRLEHWSRGRVTLVGDAAYCPTAMTGMGTTSGIVGAYILAGEIGRHCRNSSSSHSKETQGTPDQLLGALEAYEQKFQPFMSQVQKGVSFENGGIWERVSATAFGIAVMNHLMGVASFLRLDLLSRFQSDVVTNWELPVYEELLRD
ncbi:Monooxygenase FAD-binding [Penicillium argentinense]|uniref:Monooxygenase FAD-binding n=1 Tax=Penicillium argentinense TaxID=1131581 RepID=A0A9W9F7D9_9EURO|nr:Monooxygenase FAD-binding [Penicillium argentinense]KAJ5095001.1 Monooxygenase FAD-binding [Penicillium argentinense]